MQKIENITLLYGAVKDLLPGKKSYNVELTFYMDRNNQIHKNPDSGRPLFNVKLNTTWDKVNETIIKQFNEFIKSNEFSNHFSDLEAVEWRSALSKISTNFRNRLIQISRKDHMNPVEEVIIEKKSKGLLFFKTGKPWLEFSITHNLGSDVDKSTNERKTVLIIVKID